MVDPSHLPNMIYVRLNDSIGMGLATILFKGCQICSGAREETLTDCIVDRGILATAEEKRIKIDHDEAPVLGNRLQNVVLHVSARVAQLVGGRVGEDDRRLGYFERIPHSSHGCMRQVHNHSEAIHFFDYCLGRRQENTNICHLLMIS